MTITINRKVLIAIIVALILVGIFYLANRANLIFRRFSATILSSLEGETVTVPQKISNLVAVSGDEQVSLAWAAPQDGGSKITAYRIYRGEYSNDLNFLTAVSRESFTDTGVRNGTTYYYKVSAANIMGEGPMSDAVNVLPSISGSRPISNDNNGGVAPAVSVPSAVNSLVAVSGNNLVSLAWSAPYSGGRTISSYKIYRGTWAGGETFLTSTASSAFTDVNVLNNTVYYYRVSAVNSVGEGSLSNRVSATPTGYTYTYNAGLPGQISNLTAVPGDGQVSLSWSATSGSAITGYKIYRRDYYGNMTYISTAYTNSFVNYGLNNGQTYYFKVSAVNSAGEGPMSAEVGATPVASSYYYYNYNQVPGQVSGLSANPGNSQVYLSWSTPSSDSISYYKIYRSTDYYGDSFYTTAGSPSFVDTSVSNGTTYYYRVSAVNTYGEGSLSNKVSATPYANVYYPPSQQKTVPGQITNLSVVNNAGYALLSWSTPNDGGSYIQNYRIYRGTSSGSLSLLTTTQFTNYTDSSVSRGRTYYYRVSAMNAYGEGSLSNRVSVAIPSQTSYYDDDDDDNDYVYIPPSYSSEYVNITSVVPSSVNEGQTFSVSWNASSNFQGCRVWFEGSNTTKDNLSRTGSTTFATYGVPAGAYEIGVRCFRSHEIGSMSNYKEDDYMTNPSYSNIGMRAASSILVKASSQSSTAVGSYKCVCHDGSITGNLGSGVKCQNVGAIETCVNRCSALGGWVGGSSGFVCTDAN
ncbi:MAG TPA: fibronectin type III domain-containing protein [Candidatus Colwellbacteria bacterium]|nr:fibronectin type III domain-containing protein [Candidatus Colwellbacteria bacterium]